mgnify:CR=1 FL=1
MVSVVPPMKNKKGGDLNISASAIETFDRCRRKWYFGYVERIRDDKNPAAMRGDRIHDLAERYLKGEVDPLDLQGEDVRWWRYLEPGLEFAPTPADVVEHGWGVEDWVKEPCGPLNFVGKVDFYNLADLTINDWKTTGNVGWRYSKKPKALAHHIQPHVYAYALFKDNPVAHANGVRFQHVNMQSRGVPNAMEVWARYEDDDGNTHNSIPWQVILDTWQEVISTSEAMADVATNNPEAETVEGNTKACRDFGGCPHAAICTLSPMNRVTPNIPDMSDKVTTKNTDAAKDKMAALRLKLGMKALGTPAAITPPPKEEALPEEVVSLTPTEQVKVVLDKTGAVPHAVLVALAGDEAPQVAKTLGLEKSGSNWAPALPLAEAPFDPEAHAAAARAASNYTTTAFSDWGQRQRDYEAETGLTRPPGSKVMAGIIVPINFEGTAAEAVATYSQHEGQRKAAEVLEANDPTPPLAMRRLDAAANAIETVTGKSPKDLDKSKAAQALIRSLKGDAPILDKDDAGTLYKEVTTWRRVGNKRHGEVAAAANAWLEGQAMALRIEFDASLGRYFAGDVDGDSADHILATDTQAEHARVARAKVEALAAPSHELGTEGDRDDDTPRGHTDADLAEARGEGYDAGYRVASTKATYSLPTIYVDCFPLGEEYTTFSEWIAEAEALVAEDHNVPYYSLIPYNKGVALVAAKAKHAVSEGHLPPAMYVDSRHAIASLFIAIVAATEGVLVIKSAR